ncbi:MAG: hypothetical protein LBL55_06335 [Propionibacteriaceae bacterium]|jgi:hypothetical protein|nr:hypothetical protein [Propionibacteriaceae bacterium]
MVLFQLIRGLTVGAIVISRVAGTWWVVVVAGLILWALHPDFVSQAVAMAAEWWVSSGMGDLMPTAAITFVGATVGLGIAVVRIALPERLWLKRRAQQARAQACLESMMVISEPLYLFVDSVADALTDIPRRSKVDLHDARQFLESGGRRTVPEAWITHERVVGEQSSSLLFKTSGSGFSEDIERTLAVLCVAINEQGLVSRGREVLRLVPQPAREGVVDLLLLSGKTVEQALRDGLSFLSTDYMRRRLMVLEKQWMHLVIWQGFRRRRPLRRRRQFRHSRRWGRMAVD